MTDTPTETNAVTVLPPEPCEATVALRYRFDGWTPGKQRQFIQALGDTGCVRDACRAAGRSSTSAYKLRARSAAFAQEWDRAIAFAVTVLEHSAFERAVTGIEEPVWSNSKQVGVRRRYSDPLLILLIKRGAMGGVGARPLAEAPKGFTQEQIDAALLGKLNALADRRGRAAVAAAGQRRESAAAEAERLLAAGLVP